MTVSSAPWPRPWARFGRASPFRSIADVELFVDVRRQGPVLIAHIADPASDAWEAVMEVGSAWALENAVPA